VKESQEGFGFLFPTNADAAKPVQPTRAALHDPTAGFLARFARYLLHRFTPRANRSAEAKFLQEVASFILIVSLVQTQALRLLLGRFRTRHPQTVAGGTHPFPSRSVGTGSRQPHC
jgi:hypothetical protein